MATFYLKYNIYSMYLKIYTSCCIIDFDIWSFIPRYSDRSLLVYLRSVSDKLVSKRVSVELVLVIWIDTPQEDLRDMTLSSTVRETSNLGDLSDPIWLVDVGRRSGLEPSIKFEFCKVSFLFPSRASLRHKPSMSPG